MKNTSIRLAFVAIFACFAALSPQRAVAATSIADSPSGTVDTLSPLDSTTLAPALIAPASSAVSGSSVSVSFSLPEAALPGSVKLSFGGTVLTLAASQETSGRTASPSIPPTPRHRRRWRAERRWWMGLIR